MYIYERICVRYYVLIPYFSNGSEPERQNPAEGERETGGGSPTAPSTRVLTRGTRHAYTFTHMHTHSLTCTNA